MRAKTITLEAEEDVKVSSKSTGIVLKAKQDLALYAQQNIALAAQAAVTVNAPQEVTVASKTKLNLHGGGEIALKAATIGKSVG